MAENGKRFFELLSENISKVIVGKDKLLTLIVTALIADGHVLLEDIPGTGKTKLAKALSKSIQMEFSRIQFTPDLLPSDITGMNVYNPKEGEFSLRKGPAFTNILLADEINRATPRTQSGLLEVMEEHQITIDGISYDTGYPFFVIATQNPVETAGTFPLPEAQLDRFMMKLSMGMPTPTEEMSILEKYMENDPLKELAPVLSIDELLQVRQDANQVYVAPCIRDYIIRIVTSTRENNDVLMGVSPRGSLALLRSAKAYACINGRDYCTPDDIKAVAAAVLSHRILLGYGKTTDTENFIHNIIKNTTVPTEDFTR